MHTNEMIDENHILERSVDFGSIFIHVRTQGRVKRGGRWKGFYAKLYKSNLSQNLIMSIYVAIFYAKFKQFN